MNDKAYKGWRYRPRKRNEAYYCDSAVTKRASSMGLQSKKGQFPTYAIDAMSNGNGDTSFISDQINEMPHVYLGLLFFHFQSHVCRPRQNSVYQAPFVQRGMVCKLQVFNSRRL